MNKTIKKIAVATLSLLMLSGVAEARERFRLDMGGARYAHETIKLKKLIRQQYGERMRDYDLIKVRVVSEPKRRNRRSTSLELLVGGSTVDWQNVYNDPYSRNGLNKTVLQNHRNSDGTWQLYVDGRLRINKIVVVAEPKYRHRPQPPRHTPVRNISLGQVKVERYFDMEQAFYLNSQMTKTITINSVSKGISVQQVYLHLSNGRIERAYSLEGRIRQGQRLTARVNARVDRISIRAFSEGFKGSRSIMEVTAEVESNGSSQPGRGRGGRGGRR